MRCVYTCEKSHEHQHGFMRVCESKVYIINNKQETVRIIALSSFREIPVHNTMEMFNFKLWTYIARITQCLCTHTQRYFLLLPVCSTELHNRKKR